MKLESTYLTVGLPTVSPIYVSPYKYDSLTIEYDHEAWNTKGFSGMLDESCDDNHPLKDQDHYDQAFDMYNNFRNDHLIAGMQAARTLSLNTSTHGNVWILKRNRISDDITATVAGAWIFLQGTYYKEVGSILGGDAVR